MFIEAEDQKLIKKLSRGGFDAKNLFKVLGIDEELIQAYLNLINVAPPTLNKQPHLTESPVHIINMGYDEELDLKQHYSKVLELNDPIQYRTENGWEEGNFFRSKLDDTCDIIKKNGQIGYDWKLDNIRPLNLIKWQSINLEKQIPSGWKKVTVEEAQELVTFIQPKLNKWEIVLLDGGRIDGIGYGKHGDPHPTMNDQTISAIHENSHKEKFTRPSLYGKQLVLKSNSLKELYKIAKKKELELNEQLEREKAINKPQIHRKEVDGVVFEFQQINLENKIPDGWKKMTVDEAEKQVKFIQSKLHKWAIVLLDGGRIDGIGYGKHGDPHPTRDGDTISAIHRGSFSRPSSYGKQIIAKRSSKYVVENPWFSEWFNNRYSTQEQIIAKNTQKEVQKLVQNTWFSEWFNNRYSTQEESKGEQIIAKHTQKEVQDTQEEQIIT